MCVLKDIVECFDCVFIDAVTLFPRVVDMLTDRVPLCLFTVWMHVSATTRHGALIAQEWVDHVATFINTALLCLISTETSWTGH